MVDARDRARPRPPEVAAPRTLVRLFATVVDAAIVLAWMVVGAIVGVVMLSRGIVLGPWGQDALAFVSLVLPVTLTLSLMEAGPRQATLGKRRLGLRVVDREGHRISRARSLLRSAVKLAPWQMGHTAVFQMVADPTSTVALGLSIGAQLVVVITIVTMAIDRRGRALHDLVAGTRVVRVRDRPRQQGPG